MTDWAILIPIATGVAGLAVGLFWGSLSRAHLESDLAQANAISNGRHKDIVELGRTLSARSKRIIELEKELVAQSTSRRDQNIRVLGMLTTAFGLKPEDLHAYNKSTDCKTAKTWTPAPRPSDGETFHNYMHRISQWLEETQTTPRSK